MTRRAYGYLDWSKEAVLLPKPPKPAPQDDTHPEASDGNQ